MMFVRLRTGIAPVLFFVLAILAPRANAQYVNRTWLDWRTIETPHFALHYPIELDAWTRDVASRVESIDSAVARLIGYAPTARTHIVVDDPFETANGMAFPWIERPVISLWASPPTPREEIGDFRAWGEMLTTHEFAHIAHLTRPTRNRILAALLGALPLKVSALPLRTPRWVIEGYATFVEGRITGTGRPHAAWRAAILRQWALEGNLPRYQQLDFTGGFETGSFAYLAGSAYIEWLAAKHGDSSLVAVWRRLTAKQNRTFSEAFAGVYGEGPATLYGRFSAELVGHSIDVAKRVAASDSGEMVQRLVRNTGDPAISPDGARVALVVRSLVAPSRVVVWRTAPEPDTLKRRRDSLLLKSDPEDVPARSIFPPPKRVLASLRTRGGAPYESPRFLRDSTILLTRTTHRGNGTIVSDLYIWNPNRGGVRRVTRNASLREADPLPDGQSAIATRCRGGWCDLVRVGLRDGNVRVLIAGSNEHSFYRPRVSKDGATALVSVHANERWRLATIDLATNAMTILDLGDAANRYDGAWRTANEIVAVSDRGGIANVERIDLRTRAVRTISSVTGAAVAPEPNPADSSVWFLTLQSGGYDVRRLAKASVDRGTSLVATTPDAALWPALSPTATAGVALSINPVSPAKPYGFGPRLFRWFPQPAVDADGGAIGLSLVSRDVVGRSELSATFATGDASAWRGAAANLLIFTQRPSIRIGGFYAVQDLRETRSRAAPIPVDITLGGIEAVIDETRQHETWAARYRVGGSAGPIRAEERLGDTSSSRMFGFADAAVAATQRGNTWSLTENVSGNYTHGRSFDASFYRAIATANISATGILLPLSASALYGRTNTDAPLFERMSLGGGPSLVVDRMLLTQRIIMPALPTGVSIGSSAFTYRAAATVMPLNVYLWGGSTAPAGERFSRWHRVVGADWSMSVPAIPSAGTPAARGVIGVGYSLDEPFRHKTRGYVSLVLNP
jgi:hypothetical protein